MAAGIKLLVPGQEKTSGACKILQPVHKHCRRMSLSPAGALCALGHSLRLGKGCSELPQQQKCSAEEGNLPEPWGSCRVTCEMNFAQLTPKEDYADCNPHIWSRDCDCQVSDGQSRVEPNRKYRENAHHLLTKS